MDLDKIVENFIDRKKFVIAIDGNCGSGKTTMAKELAERLGANVVPIDYFYLPFKDRDPDWLNIIAGNMDFERLIKDVITPYMNKENYSLYRFNHRDDATEFVSNETYNPRLIIEGSYSFYPSLIHYYDYKIFLSVNSEVQRKRLIEREKENFARFENIWIKKENTYFNELKIKEKADLIIDTSDLF